MKCDVWCHEVDNAEAREARLSRGKKRVSGVTVPRVNNPLTGQVGVANKSIVSEREEKGGAEPASQGEVS